MALRWEDIDYDGNVINVQRNVTYTNNQPFIGSPKTNSGYRAVPILDELLSFLSPCEETGYIVFGSDSESPMTLQAFRCMMDRIHSTIDLHGATAHVFRHTMGTMLNDAQADVKTIQSILSHYYTCFSSFVTSQIDTLQVRPTPFVPLSGYCQFYFSHTGPVGGLVHRQLNTLRRLQQVSYLLLFCRRTVFNSQFIYPIPLLRICTLTVI